jgi:hypothetical protein
VTPFDAFEMILEVAAVPIYTHAMSVIVPVIRRSAASGVDANPVAVPGKDTAFIVCPEAHDAPACNVKLCELPDESAAAVPAPSLNPTSTFRATASHPYQPVAVIVTAPDANWIDAAVTGDPIASPPTYVPDDTAVQIPTYVAAVDPAFGTVMIAFDAITPPDAAPNTIACRA